MANNKELVTVLTVKTDESQQTIKGLKKEIADLKKQYDSAVIGSEEFEKVSKELATAQANLKTVMADGKKTTDNVEGSYNHLTATMAELKKEWKATADEVKRNDLAQQIDAINTELKDMDASIGNFQRNVGDYTNSFKDAFEQQQKSTENVRIGLDGLQKTASGLASGYAAVQGTLNLLNIESTQFEQAMIKVQSAMAIAQGIGGMKDLIEGGGTLITVFKNAVTGVKTFITSLNGVKAAIAATGIGLLVVAVGTLVAYWDEFVSLVNQNGNKIDKLKDDVINLKEQTKYKDGELDYFIRLKEAAGEARDSILKAAIAKKQMQYKDADELYKKDKELLDNQTDPKFFDFALLSKLGVLGQAAVYFFKQGQYDKLKEVVEMAKAERDAIAADITSMEQELEVYNTQKQTDNLNKAKDIAEQARLANIDTLEEELAEEKRIYDESKLFLEQYGIDTANLTENYLRRVQEIKEKYKNDFKKPEGQKSVLEGLSVELQMEEDMFKESRERIFQTTKEYIQKQIEEERKAAEQRRLIEEQVKTAKLDIAKNTLSSLSSIIGEQTAVGKAAAIAATTIDTYQSATAAYKAMAGIPVVGPALGAAAAAAAVISGIANVKRILSVSKDGSNASTIVNTSSPTAATPNINLAESMPIQFTRELLSDTETTNLNQSQKVIVLESDISTVQRKVEVAESNSSF